ncbi:MAG: ABC transporter ATP-binding protein [bacterium]|nr:ABC transporter ATP-binding protein [bacterium]
MASPRLVAPDPRKPDPPVTPPAATASTFAVSCRGLVKRYPDVLAVDGLDLDVRAGECFGLLGPNGAGKTTTVEMLEGLTVPDAGTIELLGRRWGKGDDRALRQQLGVQLQETKLSEKLTVRETVRLFRSFFETGREVDQVLDLAGLQEKRAARVGKLSGGQKQRLALACALVGDPRLLFLDEPSTGLDPQARLRVWEIVEEFKARGGTVILTTHYMEEAARLCDRVAIIDHGRIIALDTPAALIASLGASQIVSFIVDGELAERELAALPGVRVVTRQAPSWVLSVDQAGATLPTLIALLEGRGLRMDALSTHQATLEDVFVHLTGRGLREQ